MSGRYLLDTNIIIALFAGEAIVMTLASFLSNSLALMPSMTKLMQKRSELRFMYGNTPN